MVPEVLAVLVGEELLRLRCCEGLLPELLFPLRTLIVALPDPYRCTSGPLSLHFRTLIVAWG